VKRIWRPVAFFFAAAVLAISSPTALAAGPLAAPMASAGPGTFGSPAAQLRVDLDRLLAEHAFLTIEEMRSGLTGRPDFAAVATSVEGNSTDIVNAIGSVYGDAAEGPFGDIWRSHIGYLVDYAVSLGKGDTTGEQAALDGLAVYRRNIATFLANANPGIALEGITQALDMHTAQLIEFIDDEHRGDHAAAYDVERMAYPHMFDIGDALTKVIASKFADRYPGVDVAYSAAGTLRITLDRLLAEHAFLAAELMRSGIVAAPDYDAAQQAVDGNSADLQAVVAAAYGNRAASSFRALWDGHISAYLDYIEATRANDAAARTESANNVNGYAAQLAGFLAGANPYLDSGALSTMFQEHAAHLTGQVEAYAASDFDATYALVRIGYSHMFMVGEALAIGIATQLPHKFPATLRAPATDTAEAPEVPASPPPAFIALIGAVALLGGVVWFAATGRTARRRSTER
jgi:hypothetical protein